MFRYILRRLLQAIPTLIGISVISFTLAYAAPGDPVEFMTFDPNITPAAKEEMKRSLGLDQNVALQYVSWFTGYMFRAGDQVEEFNARGNDCSHLNAFNFTICDTGNGVIRGQLGTSIQTREPVWDRLVERMPATLELGIISLLFSLFAGIPLGVLAAVYRNSIFDNFVRIITVVFQAIPNFWLGLMLIFIFGVILGWLPTGGRQTVTLTGETDLVDRIRHLILPVLVLGMGGLALISRVMRTEMLEVLNNDYIRTAKSKGVSLQHIYFAHAFRNALIPLMTILGPAIFATLGGALITEIIFSWPGMGRLVVNSIFQQDYPMALGAIMFFAILTIIGNLLSDVLYGVVDPRVRLA